MPPSKNISFDELSQYFHLPINQVAKELGVCATILKKICRRNGIPRWPHRKIKSLDKMISNLEVNRAKNPAEREEINHEVELLKTKKLEIMKNPDILVSKNGRNQSKGNLSSSMKKVKPRRGSYTVNTFRVRELSQPEDEDSGSSEEEANCWATPPPKVAQEATVLSLLSEPVPAHIASARRPSLPILEQKLTHPQPAIPPTTPINLPMPVRRHSMGDISIKSASYHIVEKSRVHSAIDFSQKLPDFLGTSKSSNCLPCIEPRMNLVPNGGLQESFHKTIFPDWFIAEKNRVFGND